MLAQSTRQKDYFHRELDGTDECLHERRKLDMLQKELRIDLSDLLQSGTCCELEYFLLLSDELDQTW